MRRPQRIISAVLATVLTLGWSAGRASEGFEALLREAEAVRSAKPAEFQSLLGELAQRQAEATPVQQQFLRYLQAYAKAFAGDITAANAELRALFNESKDDGIRFRVSMSLANNAAVSREFADGFRALDNMQQLLPAIADRTQRQLGLLAAAVFLNQAGQFVMGGEYAERLLAESPAPRSECVGRYLGIESALNVAPESLTGERFTSAITFCAGAGEKVATNFIRTLHARHLHGQGNTQAAIDLLAQHLADVNASGYPRLMVDFRALLAEYLLANGQPDAAGENAAAAVAAGGRIPFSQPVVAAHRVLYEVALRNGDPREALDHYRRFAEADKAYLDDVKTRELAFQRVRHETEQKTQTIELLNQRNEVLQLEQQVGRRTSQSISLLAALLGLLAASIAFWAYKVKRLQLAFRKLAETDALTGLSNRTHFAHEAMEALARCQKSGAAATLIMFDLDRFKSINDRFGHAVGDWVLRRVADIEQAACADVARIGRLGGEEFALLVAGADADAALALAERCRSASSGIDSSETGHRFEISASFGLADTVSAGYDLHKLLTQADEAMYQAKREGRDRISIYRPQPA